MKLQAIEASEIAPVTQRPAAESANGSPRVHVRLGYAIALLLWAGYAVPLFVAPAVLLAPPPLDPTLLERVFPGVPGWWVAVRVACVLGAALLAATLASAPSAAAPSSTDTRADQEISPRALRVACGIAALQAFAGLWAAHLNRPLQLLYVAAFAAPTLILVVSRRRRWSQQWRRWDWSVAAAVGAVLALWLPLGGLSAWRSPWIANGVDARMTFNDLASTTAPGFNLLTGEVRPGLTALHMVFQGAGFLGPGGIPLTPQWVQADNILWLLVAGAGVGALAALIVGRAAAPVATAAFLFSPYVLMMPLFLAAFFFGLLFTVALLLLAWAVEQRGSIIALAALGAAAGITATHPAMTLVAVLVCAHVGWTLVLRPRLRRTRPASPLPAIAVATALCSFTAAVLPAIPSVRGLQHALRNYSSGRQQWVGMEVAGFGQVPPRLSEFHVSSGRPGPFDIQLGALLAPLAIPRTGLRMLGDALFDPLGAGLAMVGIALCWRGRRHGWALALLALLVLTLLPGFVSSYDRPSLTRMSLLPVPIALLAAVGYEGLRRCAVPHLRARVSSVLVTTAIIASGTVLYKAVTPHTVPRSAVGIALAALDAGAPPAALIVPGSWDPTEPGLFATQVPTRPLPLLVYTGRDSLRTASGGAAAELFLWSPGYEEEAGVSGAICAQWPGAALYTLFDEAHLSRTFAARPAGPGWQPALAPTQWRVSGCDQPLETEGSRAAAALAAARELVQQGRNHDAVEILRAAARQSFVQVRLFDTLAQALLEGSPTPHDVAEAVEWATRACQSVKFTDAEPLATLAAAYAAQQRFDDAAHLAAQAEAAARSQGNAALAVTLSERRADYDRHRRERR